MKSINRGLLTGVFCLSVFGVNGAFAEMPQPEGKSALTAKTEAKISQQEKEKYVSNAREWFRILMTSGNIIINSASQIDFYVSSIHDNLSKAGVNASVLDPSGHNSSETIEKSIKWAARSMHLDAAHGTLLILESRKGCTDNDFVFNAMAESMREHLTAAGENSLLALDETGKRTLPEMKSYIDSLTKSTVCPKKNPGPK